MLSLFRNPLAFPAGFAPGFDPNHIASARVNPGNGLSALATTSGNFTSLLTGLPLTRAGTPAGSIKSPLGPALLFNTSAQLVSVTSQPTSVQAGATFAVIVMFTTVSGTQGLAGNGTAQLIALSSGLFSIFVGAFNSLSGALSANVPYFLAASANNNNVAGGKSYNLLARNLLTGAVAQVSGTYSGSFVSPTGTTALGNNQFNTAQPANGYISAGMYAPTYMSAAALAQWADDPWAFWYPEIGDYPLFYQTVGPLPPWGWRSEESQPPRPYFTYNSFLDAPLAPPPAAAVTIRATDGAWDVRGAPIARDLGRTVLAPIAPSTPSFIAASFALAAKQTDPDRGFSSFPSGGVGAPIAPPRPASDPLPLARRLPPDWASVPVVYAIVSGSAWNRAFETPRPPRALELAAVASALAPSAAPTSGWVAAFDLTRPPARGAPAGFITVAPPYATVAGISWQRAWEPAARTGRADTPFAALAAAQPSQAMSGWASAFDVRRDARRAPANETANPAPPYTVVSGMAWQRAWEAAAQRRAADPVAVSFAPTVAVSVSFAWQTAWDIARAGRTTDIGAIARAPSQLAVASASFGWAGAFSAPSHKGRQRSQDATFFGLPYAVVAGMAWQALWETARAAPFRDARGPSVPFSPTASSGLAWLLGFDRPRIETPSRAPGEAVGFRAPTGIAPPPPAAWQRAFQHIARRAAPTSDQIRIALGADIGASEGIAWAQAFANVPVSPVRDAGSIRLEGRFIQALLSADPRFIALLASRRLDASLHDRDAASSVKARRFAALLPERNTASLVKSRRFAALLGLPVPQALDFDVMDVGETITGSVDFARWLPDGTTIASVTSVVATNYLPSTGPACVTLVNSPQIGTAPTIEGGSGTEDTAVLQQWTGVAPGTARITVTILTSDGQTLIGWAHQPVQAPN